MAIFKKSIIIILCVSLAFSPLLLCGDFSYADDEPSGAGWTPVSTNNYLVGAWKAYLKQRNCQLKAYGSTSNLTLAKYQQLLENGYKSLGLGLSWYYGKIYFRTDNDGNIQFYYKNEALEKFDQLYQQLVNDNGILEDEDNILYSGTRYKDYNDNECLVYYFSSSPDGDNYNYNIMTKQGTTYKYTGNDINDLYNSGYTTYINHYTSILTIL